MSHSFAVCAYGQSPYLRECLDSVLRQDGQASEVFIATSTPSEWLEQVAREYGVALYVNEGPGGIGPDWNFAYAQAKGRYVTIAHQDDVYCARYATSATLQLSARPDSLIFFCDYGELRGDKRVTRNLNLRIKRVLLAPLRSQRAAGRRGAKRAPIALGNAICCPSVCFNKEVIPNPPFSTQLGNALDWDCWERLSKQPGAFCYAPDVLMYHRIHVDSATSANIESDVRSTEDLKMLERFWPKPIAGLLFKAYAHGMDSNAM